jgi:hypothetical protein
MSTQYYLVSLIAEYLERVIPANNEGNLYRLVMRDGIEVLKYPKCQLTVYEIANTTIFMDYKVSGILYDSVFQRFSSNGTFRVELMDLKGSAVNT